MAERIQVSRDTGTEEHVTVRWDVSPGSYIARRSMPGVNKLARLPALDTEDLLEVMKYMRDFLNRTLGDDYLTPGEID